MVGDGRIVLLYGAGKGEREGGRYLGWRGTLLQASHTVSKQRRTEKEGGLRHVQSKRVKLRRLMNLGRSICHPTVQPAYQTIGTPNVREAGELWL